MKAIVMGIINCYL